MICDMMSRCTFVQVIVSEAVQSIGSEPPPADAVTVPTRVQLEELQAGWLAEGSRVQVYYPYEMEWHAATVERTRLVVPLVKPRVERA